MPQSGWSPKSVRQYHHIRDACLEKRGRSAKAKKTCKRIAAATANKQRVRDGSAKTVAPCACPRGWRILKADREMCWKPGAKKHRRKVCYWR